MNTYHTLSAYYDRLMTTDYDERAAYLLNLFAAHGSSPRSLLDLACGSGSLTACLASAGIDMIGVDASEEMLMIAAEKVPDAMWLCQDMRQLDLYDVVDGAVCTLDSLNHLLKTADLAAVFDRLRLFIAPGGLLIFDVNTPHKHRHTLGDNTFVFEEDRLMCVWQNFRGSQSGVVHMALDFFEETEDGLYERVSDTVTERAYSLSTWKRLLADAQFELLKVYGDLTMDDPPADCDRWVIVARNTRPDRDFHA